MSKKNRKIGLFIFGFLLTLITLVSFADPPEAPNYLITENPYKEVKTVIADKTRENAEMNISVNKLNLKSIDTYQLSETEYYIDLPKDSKLSSDEVYFISKNIEDIPDISSVNGKKIISNINKFKDYSVETADFNYIQGDNFILIDKAPALINSFIVSKLNKKTGDTKEVYLAKDFKKTLMTKVDGIVRDGAPHIVFQLSDDILTELTNEKKDIKIGKNFRDVFNQKKINKRGIGEASVNDEIKYKIDKEKKVLLIENREDINEIRIVLSDSNGINKIYGGNIFLPAMTTSKSGLDNASSEFFQYRKFKIVVDPSSGKKLYQIGEAVRINYWVDINRKLTNDSGLNGAFPGAYNFSLISNKSTNYYEETIINYEIWSKENPLIRRAELGRLIYDKSPILGKNESNELENRTTSIPVRPGENISLSGKTVTVARDRPVSSDGITGWAVAIKISIDLGGISSDTVGQISNREDLYIRVKSKYDGGENAVRFIIAKQGSILIGHDDIPTILTKSGVVELKNPILKKENSSGGILLYPTSSNKLIGETQGSVQNIQSYTGEILEVPSLQIEGLGWVKMDILARVISGTGSAQNIINQTLNLQGSSYFSDIYFIDGAKKLSVSYPKTSRGETVIGIHQWDLLAGEYEVDLVHPNTKNKIMIKLPNFSSNVYYTPTPNKEIIKTTTDRQNNSLGEFSLKTEPYNIDILGTLPNGMSRFGYKVKKILPTTINGVSGTGTVSTEIKSIARGTVLDEGDYWYILAPLGNKSDQSINAIVELKTNIPTKNQTIEVSIPGIIEIGVKDQAVGREEVINKIKITETVTKKEMKKTILEAKNIEKFMPFRIYSGAAYGWVVIYPESSSSLKAKVSQNMTNLNDTNPGNDGQFQQWKVSGETYPVTNSHLGTKVQMSIGSEKIERELMNNIDIMIEAVFTSINGLTLKADYLNTTSQNGGILLGFEKWDGQAKNFTLKVEFADMVNEYEIRIPAFKGDAWYNNELPLVKEYIGNKKIEKIFQNVKLGEEKIVEFEVGTKQFNFDVFNNHNNKDMYIEIKKEIKLKVDDGTSEVEEVVGIEIENGAGWIGVVDDTSIPGMIRLYPNNTGYSGDSTTYGKLKIKFKNKNTGSVRYFGTGLDIVTVGSKDQREKVLNDIDVTLNTKKDKGKVDISFDSNNFAMVEYNGKSFDGWSIIYPTSNLDIGAKIGYVDAGNILISDSRKNNQFKQLKINGETNPLTSLNLGEKIKFTVGNESKEVTLSTSSHVMGMVSFSNIAGIGVGLDYEAITIFNGGMYLGLSDWDLEAKDFDIKVESNSFINEYNIKVPEFNGEIYYDKSIIQPLGLIVDYTTKKLTREWERNDLGMIRLPFNIGSKDYDLRALGLNSLTIKIPKKIILEVTDIYGVNENVEFNTNLSITTGTVIDNSDSYLIKAPNNGTADNSEIKGSVSLEGNLTKPFYLINGKNLNLVSIGSVSSKGKEKRSTIIDEIEITRPLKKLKANISFDSNNFAMVQYSGRNYLGWSMIYPTSSSDVSANIGYVDTGNILITDSRKNNQFKQLKIDGKINSLTPLNLGKKMKFSVAGKTKEITLNLDPNNAMGFMTFSDVAGIEVAFDYDGVTNFNGGMYLGLSNWDLEAKDFDVKVESNSFVNEYNVKVPEFNGEIYYDKNIPQLYGATIDYTAKKIKGDLLRDAIGNIVLPFNIGSKDYDLRALGSNSLTIKIPKKVLLDVTDTHGVNERVEFSTKVTEITGVLTETSDYYLIKAPNDGAGENSEIKGLVTLERMFKSITPSSVTSILGSNLELVSIGSISYNGTEKRSIIIDSIEAKVVLNNFSEDIDMSTLKLSEKKSTIANFKDILQDENNLILKDGTDELFKKSVKDLETNSQTILNSGVSIKYNSISGKFDFIKDGYSVYKKSLQLEVRTSTGLLLYTIDINLTNDVGFEILPGKGTLNFGDFFPGDMKKAETLIEFKNPNDANIKIELSGVNNENIYKKGVAITNNTTIPLSNIQIKDLKTGINKTNNFKISGEARTAENTEAGEYIGKLDVIIIIIP